MCGHCDKFPFPIDRSERGRCRNKLCAGLCILDYIVKRDTARSDVAQRSANANAVLILRRGVISKGRVDYRELDPLTLHIGVRSSELSDEIGPAHLAPHEIVRVIHHLHLIGLGIANEKLYLARYPGGCSRLHGHKIRGPQGSRRFVKHHASRYNWQVLNAPCYIISDAHLGVASPDIERALVAFLRGLSGKAGSLVINGDLFDFWFEWKTVIPRNSFRALAALSDLHESGVPILWVAGNHDCWGDDVLRKDVGVEYHLGHWEGSLAGWNARIEHGDGLREKEDRGYRMIRPIMRNKAAIRAFRALHPNWATRLATGSSDASRTYRSRDEGRGLRAIAMRELEADPSLDLLVYGHSHVAALERAPRRGVFANAGSWLDAPTFLRVTEDSIELRSADGSAEGECLHSIDRRSEEALAHS